MEVRARCRDSQPDRRGWLAPEALDRCARNFYSERMPRTDRASRVIAAPPEEVYAALVDPEALVAWLPPEGMSARFDRFDARPGGSYRLVLTFKDAGSGRGKATADSDVVEARFVSLEPGVRVVQEVDFESDDPSFAGTMTMTWEVRSVEGGTVVEITADDVPDGISADDHAAGMASSLANLALHLEG
jgi:uncharacterized protein YndB with AHSA1/START domain